jgi:hypothetical protein
MWKKASFQQPVPVQMSQVLGIPKIGLLSTRRLVFLGAYEHNPETRFQDILYRNPIRSRALHRYTGAALLNEPRSKLLQRGNGRSKRPCLHFAILIGWTHYDSYR